MWEPNIIEPLKFVALSLVSTVCRKAEVDMPMQEKVYKRNVKTTTETDVLLQYRIKKIVINVFIFSVDVKLSHTEHCCTSSHCMTL